MIITFLSAKKALAKEITKDGVQEELNQETKDFILEKGGLK